MTNKKSKTKKAENANNKLSFKKGSIMETVYCLHFGEGKSIKDIAGLLQKSEQHIRTAVFHINRRIKKDSNTSTTTTYGNVNPADTTKHKIASHKLDVYARFEGDNDYITLDLTASDELKELLNQVTAGPEYDTEFSLYVGDRVLSTGRNQTTYANLKRTKVKSWVYNICAGNSNANWQLLFTEDMLTKGKVSCKFYNPDYVETFITSLQTIMKKLVISYIKFKNINFSIMFKEKK